jgi:hypothetical protein
VLVSVGVQLHVATPPDVDLLVHPEISVPPFLNVNDPSVDAVAVKATGVPYVAVFPPPGIVSAIVGVALATVIVTTYVDDAPALSLTTKVSV